MTAHLEETFKAAASASQQPARDLDGGHGAGDRDGACVCRLPVADHYDARNRFLGCAFAAELALASGEGSR